MSKSLKVNVSVLLDPDSSARVSKTLTALRSKGFELRESLEGIGVLLGRASPTELKALSAVSGVLSVEVERSDYTPQ
ncbi:MAG: hypothetical protein ACKOGA_12730 [Planctomycetaceae bacterium]